MAQVKSALPGPNLPMVDAKTLKPTPEWYAYFQADHKRVGGNATDKVETATMTGEAAAGAAATAQTAATTAAAAATAAQAAADAAQSTANGSSTQNAIDALKNSYVLVGATIDATDNGTNVDIDISDHTRRYANNTEVAVLAGSVAGVSYDTDFWIFYDQSSRLGGTVTYFATVLDTDAFASAANPDRHYVGFVHTPAFGGGTTNGIPAKPPGYTGP